MCFPNLKGTTPDTTALSSQPIRLTSSNSTSTEKPKKTAKVPPRYPILAKDVAPEIHQANEKRKEQGSEQRQLGTEVTEKGTGLTEKGTGFTDNENGVQHIEYGSISGESSSGAPPKKYAYNSFLGTNDTDPMNMTSNMFMWYNSVAYTAI